MHLKFTNLTVDELHAELGNLKFAGWGKCNCAFTVNGAKESHSVELSLFRSLPEAKPCSP